MRAESLLEPHLNALSNSEIRCQRCVECHQFQLLARYVCKRCRGSNLEWIKSSGIGTVYAVTTVFRAPSPEFRKLAPYSLVQVDLDDAARVFALATLELKIGDRAIAQVINVGERHLMQFRPHDDENVALAPARPKQAQ